MISGLESYEKNDGRTQFNKDDSGHRQGLVYSECVRVRKRYLKRKARWNKYGKGLYNAVKGSGVFDAVSGVLVGKPMDETYAEEYKRLLVELIDKPELPIVFNLNIGHAMPRCIMPFGVPAVVDVKRQIIRFAD